MILDFMRCAHDLQIGKLSMAIRMMIARLLKIVLGNRIAVMGFVFCDDQKCHHCKPKTSAKAESANSVICRYRKLISG